MQQSLKHALRESPLPSTCLELEITESTLIGNIYQAVEKLQALRALGIPLALDDFGTGYSSLSYLKRLPIDKLKIDASFVQGIENDRRDRAIVAATHTMANEMGLATVAEDEGVETAEQWQHLRRMGCQAYQGKLFSRPLPAAAFERLLQLRADQWPVLPGLADTADGWGPARSTRGCDLHAPIP